MHLRSVVTLLGAAVAVTASKPRVAAEQLVDAKSPSRPASGRAAEGLSNGTQIIFGRDFDGLNVFAPRDCSPGRCASYQPESCESYSRRSKTDQQTHRSMLPRRLLQDDTELHPRRLLRQAQHRLRRRRLLRPIQKHMLRIARHNVPARQRVHPRRRLLHDGQKGLRLRRLLRPQDGRMLHDPRHDVQDRLRVHARRRVLPYGHQVVRPRQVLRRRQVRVLHERLRRVDVHQGREVLRREQVVLRPGQGVVLRGRRVLALRVVLRR